MIRQVIDESMKNFKAFFRWVYVEILRLSEETVSGDLSKVRQTRTVWIQLTTHNINSLQTLETQQYLRGLYTQHLYTRHTNCAHYTHTT